jgi:chemotaxis protein methyltransferase CheR
VVYKGLGENDMEMDVYNNIQHNVKKILNIDLTYYKDEQMRRRLDSWLVRTTLSSWDEYFHLVTHDETELTRFRNYLTINVTEFFRDLDRWNALIKDVLPGLIKDAAARKAPQDGLRVWSAGCSVGVEAYTLAMVLEEIMPMKNHTILATDLDRGALAKAKAGGPYQADETKNLTDVQKRKYLETGGPPHFIRKTLASKITFREQNLMTDQFDNNFDLIVCRNVIIYFTNDAKAKLYPKFQQALRPGGVLFLGGTEIIPRPAEIGLKNYGISFYIKA